MTYDDFVTDSVIIGLILFTMLLIALIIYIFKKIQARKHKKNAENKFKVCFDKTIRSGEGSFHEIGSYINNNISLQMKIWEDKLKISSKEYAKPDYKTVAYVDMISKLKKQLWTVSLERLEYEMQNRNKNEIVEINDSFIDNLKKEILALVQNEFTKGLASNKTKSYFEVYEKLRYVYKIIFLNIGSAFHVTESDKNIGKIYYENLDNKIKKLKIKHRSAIGTYIAFNKETLNEIIKVNVDVLTEMENDLKVCFEYFENIKNGKPHPE
ncbi:hypothetical protein EDEG_01990 [Edhazardia aedis USNM 41457]|uniref:Uncharacterized protein n=1 Tax=Edhazardia aedis (strain USNM 41457) TaxID=1003232 RepID=J9DM87_EDHAE|nr:hypothetical protein EDEG_01990 [Edhazardia aedis USNM 41457]|eukprot:EJW03710.1 hypothetical protein EDEG_01990 [Edhazardia aedis USNM 41457]